MGARITHHGLQVVRFLAPSPLELLVHSVDEKFGRIVSSVVVPGLGDLRCRVEQHRQVVHLSHVLVDCGTDSAGIACAWLADTLRSLVHTHDNVMMCLEYLAWRFERFELRFHRRLSGLLNFIHRLKQLVRVVGAYVILIRLQEPCRPLDIKFDLL